MSSDYRIIKAKCVYNKGWDHKLTVGKIYEIEYLNADRMVSFMAEDGQLWWTLPSWFELIEEEKV